MKLFQSVKRWHVVAAVIAVIYSLTLVHIVQAVSAASAEPGTDENPLVAQDYVDSKINELNAKIAALSAPQAAKLEVVKVPAGKQIIGMAGTEMILRDGNASVIGKLYAGVSDLTSAKDLVTGAKDSQVYNNHLLLIPSYSESTDERGLRADTNLILLVRGSYIVK